MLTFASIPLLSATPELAAWARRCLDPRELCHVDPVTHPGRLDHLPFRPWLPPRVKLDRLYWPRGAARHAVGWYTATTDQLNAIRGKLYTGANQYRPGTLTLDDETDRLDIELYLLPARPLAQTGDRDLWLLTLVDERYFWPLRSADVLVTPGSTTWEELYVEIAGALGLVFSYDEIDSAYLLPGVALSSRRENLAQVLDAVAATLMQRIVRQPDGSVRAWGVQESQAQVRRNLARKDDRFAGGLYDLLRARGDLPGALPEQVQVSFPKHDDDGRPAGDTHDVTVTLASLALPEYGGLTGFSGTKRLRCGAVANYHGGISPVNATELIALAQQMARDWYRWQASRLDLQLIGYPAWIHEGTTDVVLYHHEQGEDGPLVSTRLMRGEWDDESDGPVHGTYGSGATPSTRPVSIGGGGLVGSGTVIVGDMVTNVGVTVDIALGVLVSIAGDLNIYSQTTLIDQSILIVQNTDLTYYATEVSVVDLTLTLDTLIAELNWSTVNIDQVTVNVFDSEIVFSGTSVVNIYATSSLVVYGLLQLCETSALRFCRPRPIVPLVVEDPFDFLIVGPGGDVGFLEVNPPATPGLIYIDPTTGQFLPVTIGDGLDFAGGTLSAEAGSLQSITISYTDLSAAGTTKTLDLFSLPAACVADYLIVETVQEAAGTGISALAFDLGHDGNTTYFATAYNAMNPANASSFSSNLAQTMVDRLTSRTAQLTATSGGANLNQLTQGQWRIIYRVLTT